MGRRRPKVAVIYTGGTFGMEPASPEGPALGLPRLTPSALRERFARYVPELGALADCRVQLAFNRDSAHLGFAEWLTLADRVRAAWADSDGVVILHGTDTLAYTACALSFLLRPCRKPVVLTGAQRPLAAVRTDARRNLVSAVEIAASAPAGPARGVSIFFDDHLLAGTRARKRSADEFAAFESPRAPPLAVVGTEVRFSGGLAGGRGALARGPSLRPAFAPGVAVLHVTPGFAAGPIREGLLPRVRALVLVLFPSGTAPTHDPELLGLLREARRRAIPVIGVVQNAAEAGSAPAGLPGPATYEATRALLREGVLWGGDLTPECAFVKASWLLGQPGGERALLRFWFRDLAGEGAPRASR